MSTMARWLVHPGLVVLGWTALLVLWETTAVALALAAWRLLRRHEPAARQYRLALAAFAATLVLALATPLLWLTPRRVGVEVATTASGEPASTSLPGHLTFAAAAALTDVVRSAPVDPRRLAGTIGIAWLAGAMVLAARLFGGWVVARRVRSRAGRAPAGPVLDTLERVRESWPDAPDVVLVESDRVEAPVVVGWRCPTLIVPSDVATQLSERALQPLLAHELAHVARGDYVINLAQSAGDVVLWLYPGARWISARVRETREFCCDEEAVRRCGGEAMLAQALTALASLGSRAHRRHAIAMTGPRLIVRIRRILQEEIMPSFISARLAALGAAIVLVVWSGAAVLGAAVDQAGGSASPADGWTTLLLMKQPGSSVLITGMTSSIDQPCNTLTISNPTDVDVSRLTVIAVAERRGKWDEPVRIFTGDVALTIPAKATATVRANFVSTAALEAAMKPPVQVGCGLSRVEFANGFEWHVTPNPDAVNINEALSITPAEVDRVLVHAAQAPPRTSPSGPNSSYLCRDQRGLTYSEGAVVAITGEPGQFALCRNGHWYETPIDGASIKVTTPQVRELARQLQQGLAARWAFKVQNTCDLLMVAFAGDASAIPQDQRITLASACLQAKRGDYENTARWLERAGFPIEKPGAGLAIAPTVESARAGVR